MKRPFFAKLPDRREPIHNDLLSTNLYICHTLQILYNLINSYSHFIYANLIQKFHVFPDRVDRVNP